MKQVHDVLMLVDASVLVDSTASGFTILRACFAR